MARLPGSVMTSNYQMGRKHGKIWKNIEKHGDLPRIKKLALVCIAGQFKHWVLSTVY